ncbi:MAG: flagellar biosynthesis protein FliR [Thermosediminibacterales bacterium]|nr:flagellar biosynthesis protein FliR [Thermosediminibacterales bacterium]
MILFDYILNQIMLFSLIFLRILGFFLITPIFGNKSFPVVGKIVFSLFISIIIIPIISETNYELPADTVLYLIAAVREIIVGFVIGFVTYLVLTSIYIAGQIIDMQMGFGIVNILDPVTNIQVPIIGNFIYIFTLLVFLTTNGHHHMIAALINSFDLLPVNSAITSGILTKNLVFIFVKVFNLAFKIAIPIVGAVFLTDIALGIVARTVPQMNVFIIGLPIKILMGIFALIIIMPVYVSFLDLLFNGMFSDVYKIIKAMTL